MAESEPMDFTKDKYFKPTMLLIPLLFLGLASFCLAGYLVFFEMIPVYHGFTPEVKEALQDIDGYFWAVFLLLISSAGFFLTMSYVLAHIAAPKGYLPWLEKYLKHPRYSKLIKPELINPPTEKGEMDVHSRE